MTTRLIVVAINDTCQAKKALEWTIGNILQPGDSVHLLHVRDFPYNAHATGSPLYEDYDYLEKKYRQESHGILHSAIQLLQVLYIHLEHQHSNQGLWIEGRC